MQDAVAKVDHMTEQQRDEFINQKIAELGPRGVVSLVQKLLSRTASAAPIYEGLKGNTEEPTPMAIRTDTPSQFKQKIEGGDWGYFLAILLMIGTAGAADQGADWKQIMQGFALTLGTAFLTWVIKRVSSRKK